MYQRKSVNSSRKKARPSGKRDLAWLYLVAETVTHVKQKLTAAKAKKLTVVKLIAVKAKKLTVVKLIAVKVKKLTVVKLIAVKVKKLTVVKLIVAKVRKLQTAVVQTVAESNLDSIKSG
ncbi:MAG: hypothetical protein KDD52_09185, partial [Bdellovibrionales bacterium]|nr:hypothetical protein [Bdellovibrionales bacterium]